ncbi:MBL fold metallo-hydrolase [Piscirickettsia litoralis]|nr:MBL fold metallo-hydrolase [Piscirickettsia litoralis]
MKKLLFIFAFMFVISCQNVISAKLPDDGNLHIYFCGTGVPNPSNQWLRHPACLAISYEKKLFLIDTGAGSSLRLGEIGLPVGKISRVFLTHLHSDHFAGLGSIINESWAFGRKSELNVYGPYGLNQVLNGIKDSYQPDTWFRSINQQGLLNPNLSHATGNIIDIGTEKSKLVWSDKTLSITAYPVHHEPVFPAFGYMLKYKSCKIFVTGDTHVFEAEQEMFNNADVVISEAMSRPLQEERLKKSKKISESQYEHWKRDDHYHSDTIDLAKLAEKAKVKHLYLTHLIPSISESEADKAKFTAGMKNYYSGILNVADDMDEIIIKSNGSGSCEVKNIKVNKVKG